MTAGTDPQLADSATSLSTDAAIARNASPQAFADVWRESQKIEGWLTVAQARALYDAAAEVPDGEWIVEIGSHHGRSTTVLAAAKKPGVRLLAVDPFIDPRWGGGAEALDTFERNLTQQGVRDEVELSRNFGAVAGKAWDSGTVGLLFVDGAHDYPTVLADVDAWRPHLSATSDVFFHDAYSSPGVTRVVFQRMFADPRFRYVGAARSLAHFKRSARANAGAWLVSAIRMNLRLAWLARNLAVKIAIRRGQPRFARLLGHTSTDFPY